MAAPILRQDIPRDVDILALLGGISLSGDGRCAYGRRLTGACPICGTGRDRLTVYPDAGKWFCRQCTGPRLLDGIDLLMRRDGLSFPDACARLGSLPTMAIARVEPQEYIPDASWRAGAESLLLACQGALWGDQGSRARLYLEGRGLRYGTIRDAGLGYQTADAWLDGDWRIWPARAEGRHWLPRGIVIPARGVDGLLYGLSIRRPVTVEKPKYVNIAGSAAALCGASPRHPNLLVTEGLLDLAIARQEAGHLVDVATLGSCSVGVADRWRLHLARYRHILVCYDNDDAGERGRRHWSWCRRAMQVHVPGGGDLGEAQQAGISISGWVGLVLAGLASGEARQ